MTPKEVLDGLRQLSEYWEKRSKHDASDRRAQDLYFMNVSAEAAVLITEQMETEDDGR